MCIYICIYVRICVYILDVLQFFYNLVMLRIFCQCMLNCMRTSRCTLLQICPPAYPAHPIYLVKVWKEDSNTLLVGNVFWILAPSFIASLLQQHQRGEEPAIQNESSAMRARQHARDNSRWWLIE